ncbi:MAG: SDR family oxidoreductase [Myxococcales bacterium]|nr:SDR family oxidoreductase [Myxococcales bacterium]
MRIRDFLPADLLRGNVVFVTGGGSGINLGIARHFAALGANLAICGRTRETLEAAADELRGLGATVVAEVADVRDYDAVAAVLATSEAQLGPVDVVVCGAAGNFLCPVANLSAKGFKTVIEIDLLGSFNAAKAAFEQLKRTRGSLIFISAGQAFLPFPLQAHAGAAKAGVDNLMRNLALEWGALGIRSNSIAPGPIAETEGMRRLAVGKMRELVVQSIPLARLGTVDDIGEAAVFLASPLASFITGTVLLVDGGQTLHGSGLMTGLMMSPKAG